MKIRVGKDLFTIEADLSKIENALVKTIPQKIMSCFKNQKI
jgi:hypothetical protein